MRPARGQTLVFFALGVLLLVLAVMLTLGLANTARRKMQLQVSADAAAYSQAVATARTFNSLALLNRAQAAAMVALTGVQSAVSYAGAARGANAAAIIAYREEFSVQYCQRERSPLRPDGLLCAVAPWSTGSGLDLFSTPCRGNVDVRAEFTGRIAFLDHQRSDFARQFADLDALAGKQALAIHVEANRYAALEQQTEALLAASLEQLAFGALASSQGRADSTASASEVAEALNPGSIGAAVQVASGSRAHPFVTRRADGDRVIEQYLKRKLGPYASEVHVQRLTGGGYFGASLNHGTDASDRAAWGEEHSTVEVNYQGPHAREGIKNAEMTWTSVQFGGWASTTDQQDLTDRHSWCASSFDELHAPDNHPLLPHPTRPVDACPNSSCIWPEFLDVNPAQLTNPANAFGQPRLQVAATLPPDPEHPWNLAFHYQFSTGADGADLALGEGHAVGTVTPSKQAVSSAMAYYHRPGHWREPPNLWNPYWRATLVRADVDDPDLKDPRDTLTSNGQTWAAESIRKLTRVGFKGIP